VRSVPKTLAGGLAVFLLAVGLAACGGSSGDSSSSSSTTEESASSKQEAAEFVPKQHRDSGGGSSQYIVKGGDNSVQEFGEEADQQEFEAAAAVFHGFLDARAEGDWAAACEYMSKSIVESFEKVVSRSKQAGGDSCAVTLEKLISPAAKGLMKTEAEKADVGSLRVEGNRSFIIYTGDKGTVLAMPMQEEGGKWKVASVTGTPLQ